MSGKVYLIGAGPGDPGLLTLKGAQALAQATVVVYDYLANPRLLELAPAGAQRIYVGKKGGDHTKAQEEINALLVGLGLEGHTVARLKGGDPFVFGRGGEEASALHEAGVEFVVVPGVTSAIAAPAYAGIPVTDRRAATEVAFITGHEDPTKPESTINWSALAGLSTLVFLMGIKNLPHICGQLRAHGKPGDTPAACVRWGTTPRQMTVTGTLDSLPAEVEKAGLTAPAITIVGRVIELRDELRWFDRLPLLGKRILNTRTRGQASKLSERLLAMGAEVIEVPTIEIQPPADLGPLHQAAAQVEGYDWLLFTSANGVEAFFGALKAAKKDARALAGVRVGAIGPATAQAVADHGIVCDATARTFVAEGLLEVLGQGAMQGQKVLLPRAAQAREVLPDTLEQWGAEVTVVPAYQTVRPEGSAQALAEAVAQGIDAVAFTASSTVENFCALLAPEALRELAKQVKRGQVLVAAIGPITAETAQAHGLKVRLQPERYTIDALVDALTEHYRDVTQ